MRSVIKIVIVVLALSFLIGTAYAFMPSERGVSAPRTVWSDLGVQGTVSGRVVTSMDQAEGLGGAYVALVNAMSPGKEYCNATTDEAGYFCFTGVNATYSSALQKGPDGTGGSYQQGMNAYMIYANGSSEEIYSSTFGIDANHTSYLLGPIVIFTGVPEPEEIITPEPTSAAEPTAVAETPVPATATPGPTGQLPSSPLLAAAALLIAAALLYPGKK
jgi:hypothetical protein